MPSIPDVTTITETSRKVLGTPDFEMDKKNWQTSDINLDDKYLKIQGHPVMEAWEHPYMRRLAEITSSQGGKVLELGFGMNISADYMQNNKNSQAHPLSEHWVIEANNKVADRANTWATEGKKSKVVVCRGYSWDVSPGLASGSFDGIMYDTYPLSAGGVNRHQRGFFQDAARLLKMGGVFTYFCNEPLDLMPEEYELLNELGFNVSVEVIPVPTPDDCQYWRAKTIVAPVCIKVREVNFDHRLVDKATGLRPEVISAPSPKKQRFE